MKRRRLPKGSARKKGSRLIIAQAVVIPPEKKTFANLIEKKVYRFLHEAGHDIEKFDDDVHAYLHHLEDRLERAGHTAEESWRIMNSRDNYADFTLMPGRNPEHKRVSMEGAENIIHKISPQAKIEWMLEPGAKNPLENRSVAQSFRVTNVNLGDIVAIDTAMMQFGGGFK
jgi:hypothetical protein